MFDLNDWELDEIPVGERELPEDGPEANEDRPFPSCSCPRKEKNGSTVLRLRVLLQSDTKSYGEKFILKYP